jgi:hypothetical protein
MTLSLVYNISAQTMQKHSISNSIIASVFGVTGTFLPSHCPETGIAYAVTAKQWVYMP